MDKIIILVMLLLSGCAGKTVYIDKYHRIDIDPQFTADAKKPSSRVWSIKDKQGNELAKYIIDLNMAIDEANIRFNLIRDYMIKYNIKVDNLNDKASKK
jgi:hypothetical protein